MYYKTYIVRLLIADFSKGLYYGHHHGCRGRVRDEHGDEGRRGHEPKHGHLGRGPHQQNDPKRDTAMEAAVLDARGQHEAAEHHEVGPAHVVDGYFVLKRTQLYK